MADFATSNLNLIDERVRAGLRLVTKMGTVTARDTTGARAMVTMDGSSGVPLPAKCFETVVVQDGDRVGLVRFESDWIIVGNYTLRTLGTAHYVQEFSSNGTVTSATYIDISSSPTVVATKYRDTTQFRVRLSMSMYATATVSIFYIGVRFNEPLTGTSFDMNIIRWPFHVANVHIGNSGTITTVGSIPAGTWTITGRWLRISGTGVGTVNSDDQISIEAEEVVS